MLIRPEKHQQEHQASETKHKKHVKSQVKKKKRKKKKAFASLTWETLALAIRPCVCLPYSENVKSTAVVPRSQNSRRLRVECQRQTVRIPCSVQSRLTLAICTTKVELDWLGLGWQRGQATCVLEGLTSFWSWRRWWSLSIVVQRILTPVVCTVIRLFAWLT